MIANQIKDKIKSIILISLRMMDFILFRYPLDFTSFEKFVFLYNRNEVCFIRFLLESGYCFWWSVPSFLLYYEVNHYVFGGINPFCCFICSVIYFMIEL